MIRRKLCALIPSTVCRVQELHTTSAAAIRQRTSIPRPIANRNDSLEHHFAITDVGYKFNYHRKGDRLPRLAERHMNHKPVPMLSGKQKLQDTAKDTDHWTEEDALFGQNDYIDILGNGSVHPSHLLHHVPPWLRGFPGQYKTNEVIRLIHYRNIYQKQMERSSPRRWHQLQKRIQFLLNRENYRKQDEVLKERDHGLWEEKPDYDYKDRAFRSFEHHHR